MSGKESRRLRHPVNALAAKSSMTVVLKGSYSSSGRSSSSASNSFGFSCLLVPEVVSLVEDEDGVSPGAAGASVIFSLKDRAIRRREKRLV